MFAKESASVLVIQILTFGLGFASSIVVARLLGPAGRGQLALITTFVSVVTLVGNLGLGQASIYFINREPKERTRLIRTSLSLQAGVTVALTCVMLACWQVVSRKLFRNEVAGGCVIAGIVLLFPVMSFTTAISNTYIGLLQFRPYGAVQAGAAALQLTALLAVNHYSALTVGSVVVVYSLAPLPALLVATYWLRRCGITIRPSVDIGTSKRLLGYGGRAWIGNILQFFNYRLDVYFVNYFWGATSVGFYSIAVSLAEMIWYIPNAVSTVLFPRTASDWGRARDFTPRVSRNVAFITVVAAVALAVGGPWVLTLAYGERFRPAVQPLLALLPGIIFLSVGKVVASDLAGRNKPQSGVVAALTSLGLTVALDILLIPRLGTTGAGVASSLAYGVTSIVLLAWYIRVSGNGLVSLLFMQKSDLRMYSAVLSSVFKRATDEKAI